MNNDDIIITPSDSPFYRADWRFRLATQMASDPDKKRSKRAGDEWVDHVAKCLKAAAGGKSGSRKGRCQFERIASWGPGGANEHVGQVVQALLLTEAPMDAIAADIGCSVEELWAYALIFFDVRDSNGNMSLSPAQRTFFATEGCFKPTVSSPEHLMWRRVAVKAGYRALLEVLELGTGHWADAPAVDLVEVTVNMGRAETLAKLASGRMSTGELSRLESNRIRDRLVRHTTGEDQRKDNEAMEVLLKLMQMLAPKMVTVDKIQRAQEQVAAENMLQAEQNITQVEAGDRGGETGHENLDRVLKKKGEELRRAHASQSNTQN